MYKTSAMFLHLVFSTKVFYFKERLANLFLPCVSLSSRGGGNGCWQQVYPPAVAVLTGLLYGLCTIVKQHMQHCRDPTRQFGFLWDFTLALISQWNLFSTLLEMCSQKSGCPQQPPGCLYPMWTPPERPAANGLGREKHSSRGQLFHSWEGCLR